MKTEQEIRDRIENLIKSNNAPGGILTSGPASWQVNAPRAFMQIDVIGKLETLHWVLGEKRPSFAYDEKTQDI